MLILAALQFPLSAVQYIVAGVALGLQHTRIGSAHVLSCTNGWFSCCHRSTESLTLATLLLYLELFPPPPGNWTEQHSHYSSWSRGKLYKFSGISISLLHLKMWIGKFLEWLIWNFWTVTFHHHQKCPQDPKKMSKRPGDKSGPEQNSKSAGSPTHRRSYNTCPLRTSIFFLPNGNLLSISIVNLDFTASKAIFSIGNFQ